MNNLLFFRNFYNNDLKVYILGGVQQLLFSVKKCKKAYINNTKTKSVKL